MYKNNEFVKHRLISREHNIFIYNSVVCVLIIFNIRSIIVTLVVFLFIGYLTLEVVGIKL